MRKKLIISLLLVIGFTIATYNMYIYFIWERIQPNGVKITQSELFHDIRVLTNRELKSVKINFFPYSSMFIGRENEKDNPLFITGRNTSLHADSTILEISGITGNNYKLDNVTSVMRTHLYLNRHPIDIPIQGIASGVRRKWVMMDAIYWIQISRSEFQELYEPLKIQNLPDEQLIQKLSDTWIANHHYEGYLENNLPLTYPDENVVKMKVEEAIPPEAKGTSYRIEIDHMGRPRGTLGIVINVDNATYKDQSVCEGLARDILTKLKPVEGIGRVDMAFTSNGKMRYSFYTIDWDQQKQKDDIMDGIKFEIRNN